MYGGSQPFYRNCFSIELSILYFASIAPTGKVCVLCWQEASECNEEPKRRCLTIASSLCFDSSYRKDLCFVLVGGFGMQWRADKAVLNYCFFALLLKLLQERLVFCSGRRLRNAMESR
ncbi:hypothetical protein QWZ13_19735 [Reinekea marina]|uniref:hypothetical protein n=1 Tax=Reinekea marina TaxID=1310421 RepID=UPI0025B619DD|nr:hypothetical protein [Reinekea marina]MDN3650948.1 hypothetical protein [Reinekea marina]MDN3651144.1 hypothetical protein [Reinekea marina]